MSDNNKIAKNTLLLYIRMFIIMGVTLYTSRVVLDKLGVVDYGLYGVVGGIVAMLSFLNGTLMAGTSRFITYELGAGNKQRLWETFNTSFYTHSLLAIIVILILETGGLWFLYHRLVIPADRLNACFWVFQLSILTTVVSITQVPYNSLVTSHEKFNIYAYISIFEAIAKLSVCYALIISHWDRLILYALLLALIQLLIAFYYRIYCNRHFEESHLALAFNKQIFRDLMGFSGWNIIAQLTHSLRIQGVVILINMFLAPVVVAAQTIANQVCNAAMGFVNNFRVAFNPQIIKLYASGDKEESKKLTLNATIVSFDMVLLLALPCIYAMPTIMDIWLVKVPDYAVLFTQCMLACNVIDVFNASFYIPMLAANKIKFNSMSAVFIGIGQFVLLYFVLRYSKEAMWVPIFNIVLTAVYSLLIKPYVLWKDIDYSIKELGMCYWCCLKVLVLSLVVTIPLYLYLDQSLASSTILILSSLVAVAVSSWLFLDTDMKDKIVLVVKNKIHKR